jgi:hypothetical protein
VYFKTNKICSDCTSINNYRRDVLKNAFENNGNVLFQELTWKILLIVEHSEMAQVQEATASAAGIAPELAKKETVCLPF